MLFRDLFLLTVSIPYTDACTVCLSRNGTTQPRASSRTPPKGGAPLLKDQKEKGGGGVSVSEHPIANMKWRVPPTRRAASSHALVSGLDLLTSIA